RPYTRAHLDRKVPEKLRPSVQEASMSKRSVFLLLLSIVASLILAGAPALAAISAYAAIGINDGVAVVGGVTRSDNPGEDQAVYPVLGVQILSYVTPASSGGAQSQVTAQLPQYYQA